MNSNQIQSLIPVIVIVFIAIVLLLMVLSRILVNVGAREIAIKERRYLGAKMPPGRVVATKAKSAYRQTCSNPACT